MRFAKLSFVTAGVWGLLSLTPLLFAFDAIGMRSPPPITHPEYYYGFLGVALAWQIAFFVIARDPQRYRLMMLPAMVEKFGYAFSCLVLLAQHRVTGATALFGGIDCLLGVAFLQAWRVTTPSSGVR